MTRGDEPMVLQTTRAWLETSGGLRLLVVFVEPRPGNIEVGVLGDNLKPRIEYS